MKTQEEIEKKYKEINQMMKDNMPTEESVQELESLQGLDVLKKIAQKSSTAISIDAQRFILEWVLEDHD